MNSSKKAGKESTSLEQELDELYGLSDEEIADVQAVDKPTDATPD